jgi:hypothetical protein
VEVQKAYNISDQDFNRVAEELFSLKEQGKIGKETIINPKMIAQAIQFDRQVLKAQDLIKGINAEASQNREAVESVVNMLKANMGEEEILLVLTSKYETTNTLTPDKLSNKINKSVGEQTVVDQISKPQNEDMWNFDDV